MSVVQNPAASTTAQRDYLAPLQEISALTHTTAQPEPWLPLSRAECLLVALALHRSAVRSTLPLAPEHVSEN